MSTQNNPNSTVPGYDEPLSCHIYESWPLTAKTAEGRSTIFVVDAPEVDARPLPVLPPTDSYTATHYPRYIIYDFGNIPFITLPINIADPPPVAEQYLHTSAHTYHIFTSRDLPDLLFRIEPTAGNFDNVHVPKIQSAEGRPVTNDLGEVLRFFSFLPRYISTNVSGALLEYWFRLDHRLEMGDILMRIEAGPGKPVPNRNTMNMRRVRFRASLNLLPWRPSRSWPTRSDVDMVGKLSADQICFNTTMLRDPVTSKLLKPIFSSLECKPTHLVGYVVSDLPVDHFLRDVSTTIPTIRMIGITLLRRRCQELAVIQGLGQDRDNYQRLAGSDAPCWWNDRNPAQRGSVERPIHELSDGLTHSEFMQREIGSDQGPAPGRRQVTRRSAVQPG